MKVVLAESYGFCFGVKRAIKIAEEHPNSSTLGPLIHNKLEINRLKLDFDVGLYDTLGNVKKNDTVIIRTHGIPKDELAKVKQIASKVINATCPFVTTPQQIVKKMSEENYSIVIFGDSSHPEVMGVKSYGNDVHIVLEKDEIDKCDFKFDKIAAVAQTTRNKEKYLEIVNHLILGHKEVRVFNTICDATFENQAAAEKLSNSCDIVIIIGGKNSSNTKQLLEICKKNCSSSYLVEDENELDHTWFNGKNVCGVTAGASTPEWIISRVVEKLKAIK
jgi:4-hydroxy-3-methylbut-2-enyl diphosphate reductase